ncbi:hypothetical protein WA158_001883 [Blastocystis sp. Blastoise]
MVSYVFQDEVKFEIPEKFIIQFPDSFLYKIYQLSVEDEINEYYIDYPSYPMKNAILFLMKKRIIDSALTIKEACDVYETLDKYFQNEASELIQEFNYYLEEQLYSWNKSYSHIKIKYMNRIDNCRYPVLNMMKRTKNTLVIHGILTESIQKELLSMSSLFRLNFVKYPIM